MKTVRPGYRVGRLTVLCETGEKYHRYSVWRCRCDCGNEIELDTRRLKRGAIKDCGCKTKANTYCRDLTGQRFGRLVALHATDKRAANGTAYWHCICDCGKEKDILSSSLTSGDTKSCGCLRGKRNKPKTIPTPGANERRYIEIPRYASAETAKHTEEK